MLRSESQRLLLNHARKTLEEAFTQSFEFSGRRFETATAPIPDEIAAERPCFVTITKRDRLRGCIGCTSTDQPLYQNVAYYTHQAAFRDPRFPPVERAEIAELKIEISVLGPLRPLKNLRDLKLGEQGLVVRSGNRQGLLLATVAIDHGWTPEEFLAHTCEKAQLDPKEIAHYEVQTFDQISFTEN